MAKYNTSLRMNVTDDMTNENDQTGEVTNKQKATSENVNTTNP